MQQREPSTLAPTTEEGDKKAKKAKILFRIYLKRSDSCNIMGIHYCRPSDI